MPNRPKRKTAKRLPARPAKKAEQAAFLEHYASVGVITAAARLCGISRIRHYEWWEDVEKYPDYRQRFADAHEQACDRLETEAVRRAVQGWDETVWWHGKSVGTVRKMSDRLLEVLLKARRPAIFRERYTAELTGAGGGPIASALTVAGTVTVYLPKQDDEPSDDE